MILNFKELAVRSEDIKLVSQVNGEVFITLTDGSCYSTSMSYDEVLNAWIHACY